MPKISKVEEIVATRELVYISSAGRREVAKIEIGKPFPTEQGDYVCPYRVGSKSYEHIYGPMGIDSYQALELSMKTIEAELIFWIRNRGGSFEFLGEPGTGLEKDA